MALLALVATLGSACTGGSDPPPTAQPTRSPDPVKVAFFQDATLPGASQVVTPSYLALRLALSDALDRGSIPVVPEVVDLDTEGDPSKAAELARTVAEDPSYVAAVVAPFWSEPGTVAEILDAAGIATLSLSGLDRSFAHQRSSPWRRLVAGTGRQVSSLASVLRASSRAARGICIIADDSVYGRTVSELLSRELGSGRVTLSATMATDQTAPELIKRIREAACGIVAWSGFAPGAASLRTDMTEAGLRNVGFAGMDAMKADGYLATADGAEGTTVVCACVDLATSTRSEDGRFVHDFQSEYGSPPGVYAAEGWDAGEMLVQAFSAGADDRVGAARSISSMVSFRGLANTYRFEPGGALEQGSTSIHVFTGLGVRWVPEGAETTERVLPVATPGYLSMGACRTGRPFVYATDGVLHGFNVELAATIARRLGLTLSWSERSCGAALRAVAAGTLDAVIAPVERIAQGTPSSRVALSLHAALITTRRDANAPRPPLERLQTSDVVAVVGDRALRAWALATIPPTGATLRMLSDPDVALDGVVSGRFAAVVEPEPDAWAAVERRPHLAVAQSVDIGAYDVIVAKGPDAIVVAAIDQVLGRLIHDGRYTLLFAKNFPGTPVPSETGT